MLGFYSWQINEEENRQNDAFMAGIGIDLIARKILFHNSMGGYYGYIGNGDRPLVYRSRLSWTNNKIDYFLKYQHGLHDFDYKTVMAGIVLKWGGPRWLAIRKQQTES